MEFQRLAALQKGMRMRTVVRSGISFGSFSGKKPSQAVATFITLPAVMTPADRERNK